VSTKHFCEKCGKEINMKGNDYMASLILFGRTSGREDGWRITFDIRREYDGKPTDLCAKCVTEIIEQAMAERQPDKEAKAG
jgi:hypothetical protein